jgi:hypothetical protein
MSNTQSKQPTHRAYAVTKRGDKAFWREIGAAWAHDDGDGFNLKLDYLPLNGAEIVICKPKANAGEGGAPSFITPGHVRAFQAARSQLYDNIVLWSCRINGEPGVAIVMVDYPGENRPAVMPLFVAITPGMELTFEDEQSGSGSGSGPRRSTRQEFAFNCETMTCRPAG